MDRRAFLKTGSLIPAAALTGLPRVAAASAPGQWRVFEVSTQAEVEFPAGVTRIWLPVPLATDTRYQKSLGNTWSAEGGKAAYTADTKYSMGVVHAEFPESVKKPALTVVSRFATVERDHAVDVSRTGPVVRENPAVLRLNLQPTELIPTDGIVRETARAVVKGAKTDLEKARAIYEWVVENTYREPTVRGCGWGDIKSMLETKNFGGKCGDLNAMFVGLARAAGVPARDVYGIRVARSQYGYASLGVGSPNITRAALPRRVLLAGARLGAGGPGRRAQGDTGGAAGQARGYRRQGRRRPQAAVRQLGDELACLQLRARRPAAGRQGREDPVLHVPER